MKNFVANEYNLSVDVSDNFLADINSKVQDIVHGGEIYSFTDNSSI